MISFSIFIILLIFALILVKLTEGKPQMLENGMEKKYFASEELDYIGGIDGVYDLVKVYISMSNDSMLNVDFFNSYSNYNKKINFHDIKSMSIKTEEQVKEEVSLGKLVVFGVLALGMKNEKRYLEKYLIINYLENGQEKQIVTRGNYAPRIKECYEKILRGENVSYIG